MEQCQEKRRCVYMCAWLFEKKNRRSHGKAKNSSGGRNKELRFPTTTDPTPSTQHQQRPAHNHVSTVVHELCNEAAMAEAVDGTLRQLVR